MKQQHHFSARQRRIVRAWLPFYQKMGKVPQKGVIVLGGGLDARNALEEARMEGYQPYQRGNTIELR